MSVLKRAMWPLMFVAAFPMTAVACNKWDVTGTWHIKQANGYSATLELTGRDGNYNGYAPPAQNAHRQAAVTDITLNGSTFSMSLLWGPDNTNATDSVGVYTGQIASDGRISGATYDQAHPKNVTTWSRTEPLKCLDSAAPKPIHRLGKNKPASPPAPDKASGSLSISAASHMTPLPAGSSGAGVGAAAIWKDEPTRSAPTSGPVPARVPEGGSETCISGFVWRDAREGDHVCVTPESRSRVARENSSYRSRVDPNGAQGLASCKTGYVWREAYDGDIVCVTPEVRDQVREENQIATTRVSAP
jgi:hypothetical protein